MSDEQRPDDGAGERRAERPASRWTWAVPLGLAALLAGLYFVWPGYQSFVDEAYRVLGSGDRARVEEWVKGFGAWGFAVILALMFMQTVLAFLPSLVTMVVAVLAYGPVAGGALAWGGMLLTACFGYGIGRSLGPVTVDRLLGTKTERKMARFVDRYGVWAVIAARISPVFSTDAVSFAAGMAKMRFASFVLATAVGTLPLAGLVAYLGADIDRLKTGLIWVSVASLAVFVAYVAYDRRRRSG